MSLDLEGALKSIVAFFAAEGIQLSKQDVAAVIGTPKNLNHADLGVLASFGGRLGTTWLSARANVVYYSGKSLRAEGAKISIERALELATQFAARHVSDFAQRNFVRDDVQGDAQNITAHWTEKPRQGEFAIFPNHVEVVVALSVGQIIRFTTSDLRSYRSTPPRLSQAEARNVIKGQFEKCAIEELDLLQLPVDSATRMATVWTAMILRLSQTGPVPDRITIDADTGEVIR